jgi:hypothetical protein
MEKKGAFIVVMVLASVFCFIPMASAGTPFTVYGYVTNYEGAYTNGVSVTVVDTTTSQSLKTTSVDGDTHSGFYQTNLGNLGSQWSRGDSIYVYVSYWVGNVHYYGVENFTIPVAGYIYSLNISTNKMEMNVGDDEILPPAPATNVIPVLVETSISKEMGTLNTTFWFNATYLDANNEPPHRMSVIIDGATHSMAFQSFISKNYTTGARYSYHTTFLISGDHTFWFYCNDGYANSSDYTVALKKPHIIYEPTLSNWKFTPISGYPETNFTYSVVYTSREGLEPTYIYVNVNGVRHDMTRKSGIALTGETFECTFDDHILSPTTFEVFASDGYYTIGTNKYDGPLVIEAPADQGAIKKDDNLQTIAMVLLAMCIVIPLFIIVRKRKGREQPTRYVREPFEPKREPIRKAILSNSTDVVIRTAMAPVVRKAKQ